MVMGYTGQRFDRQTAHGTYCGLDYKNFGAKLYKKG